ncbi:hypothetical protein BDW22DRAFT_1421709 [Trametopsis cervina]|nr:hypothetical protein BDW22DRAFT_1421709 [Trametopsis cervina]
MKQASRENNSQLWSHNLRTLPRCSSDSDSGSDLDPGSSRSRRPAEPVVSNLPELCSEDTRLLKQIDLSSRHDDAKFESNPWSIAKVNAAIRPARALDNSKPIYAPSGSRKPPQGKLVEGFRRQAQKFRAVTESTPEPTYRPLTNVLQGKQNSHNEPTSHLGSQSLGKKLGSSVKESVYQPSKPDTATAPTIGRSIIPVSPASSPPSFSSDSRTTNQLLQATRAHDSIPAPDIDLHPHKGSISNMLASMSENSRTRAEGVLQSPLRSITPVGRFTESYTAAVSDSMPRSALSIKHRQFMPRSNFAMSSPVRSTGEVSATRPFVARQAFSSPIIAPSRHDGNYKPVHRIQQPDWSHEQLVSSAMTLQPRPRTTLEISSSIAPMASMAPSPQDFYQGSPMDEPMIPQSIMTNTAERPRPQVTRDVYDSPSSPDAAWSTLPPAQREKRKPHRSEQNSGKFRLPIASITRDEATQDSKRRRVSYLPPAPAKTLSHRRLSYETDNPLAWKVVRNTSRHFPKSLMREVPSNERPMKVQNSREVHVYSPKHRGSPFKVHRALSSRGSYLQRTEHADINSASTDTPDRRPRGPRVIPAQNRLLSSPRSDSLSDLQGDNCEYPDDSFTHIPFDSEMLEDRYIKMRKTVAERKRAAAGVWDDLGLPSCGVVYQSTDDDVPQATIELPIVTWGNVD